MSEEANLESANVDRTWVDKILEILLLNTSVEDHKPTKKRFFEIAFQMFYEGSFYSENETMCNINLANFIGDDKHFDFSYLESVIRMAVRFMDNEHLRMERCAKGSTVTIYLHDLQAVFDSEGTTEYKDEVITRQNLVFFTVRTAIQSSMELVEERGSLEGWEERIESLDHNFKVGVKPFRNFIRVHTVFEPNINSGNSNLT